MVSKVNEYCILQDWLDKQIDNGMNDLDPIARSVERRLGKLLATMTKSERTKALITSEPEPMRYW